jgi:hypothetical protein
MYPGSESYEAHINGNFVFRPGNVFLDFDNSEHRYDFDGGALYLTVNDLMFDNPGAQTLTGTLRYEMFQSSDVTSTPEPSTFMLLGIGLAGAVPLVWRRRISRLGRRRS